MKLSKSQNWKKNEEEWKREFQDLISGNGRFEDLVLYGDFLGQPVRHDRDYLGLGREVFQGEVHRLFPAEQEAFEREKQMMFDCHVLVFETDSKLFQLFCRLLALNFYMPVILDIHEILKKCSLSIYFF